MTENQEQHLPLESWHEAQGGSWMLHNGWRLPGDYGAPAEELTLLEERCGMVDRSNCGVLRISGETARDFLHRMTSAPVGELESGHGMETVVTTSEGRFVDWVTLYHTGDDYLTMVTSPGAGTAVIEHLQGYIFFKDDVQFEQAGSEWILLQFSGPESAQALEDVLGHGVVVPANPYKLVPVDTGTGRAFLTRITGIGESDFQLRWPAGASNQLETLLNSARNGWRPAGHRAYNFARIAAGVPEYPGEIAERYMLTEAHLETPLDLTSCFAGQEVIARTLNFDKIKQHLCHLEFSGEAGTAPELPVRLYSGEDRIGWLTSLAESPRDSTSLGLGYVRTQYVEKERAVEVRENDWTLAGELTGKTAGR